MRTRNATLDDVPRLVAIEDRCFRGGPYDAHRWDAERFARHLGHPRGVLRVATDDANEPIGFVVGWLGAGATGHLARVLDVAIHPSHRGSGIARALLIGFFRHVRREGRTAVMLEVAAVNRPARALFEALGFRTVRRLPNYYRRGMHGLRMRLALAPRAASAPSHK